MKHVKIVIAIVGLALAAYLIVKAVTPEPTETGFVVQCDKCGKAFIAEVNPIESSFPTECKFCKEKSAYRLLYCKDCQKYFTHHPEDGVSCPHCGLGNLDQPDQVPE